MNTLLKLEELAMFGISIALFTHTGYAWWVFLVFLFVPDIGMIGYIVNSKMGAITYNLFHHKGIAVLVLAAGFALHINELFFAGILLFAHSSLDRLLGYGLKHFDSFKNTHLGEI